ncbi:MAG: UbiA family prenyltransferase [bacterium]|nr:UbiA family prenyltransferase [bacterium]
MPTLLRDVARSALHRIDAWGVALIVCSIALLVHDAVTPANLLLVLAVTAAFGLGYVVNDYFDSAFDAQEEAKARHNLFVRHRLGPFRATALFAAAVPLGVFASFGARGVLVAVTCVLVIWAYSAPPLRLKAIPGLDLLTHALFVQTFAYFICVFLTGVEWLRLDAWLLAINFLASLSGQLAQQVRDFDRDSRTDRNFATTVGLPATVTCLRVTTLAVVVTGVAGFAIGVLPPILAPLALGFGFATAHRLGGGGALRPSFQVYLPTTAALAYTGVLLFAELH